SDVVGAEQMRRAAALLPRGRPEALTEKTNLRVVRCDDVSEDREQRQRREDNDGKPRQVLATEGREAPGDGQCGGPGCGGAANAHSGSSDRSRRTADPPRGWRRSS